MSDELMQRLVRLKNDMVNEFGRTKDRMTGAVAGTLAAVCGTVLSGQTEVLVRHGMAMTEDGKAGLISRSN